MDEAQLAQLIGRVVTEAVSGLASEIQSVRSDLTSEIQSVRSDLTSQIQELSAAMTAMDDRLSADVQSLKFEVADLGLTMSAEFRNVREQLTDAEKRLNDEIRQRMKVEEAAFGDIGELRTAVKDIDRRVKVLEAK